MCELDPIIHAPARLRIMTRLSEELRQVDDQIAFSALQRRLEMTSGNLTTHLGKLESAGYVRIEKTFVGRRPTTYIGLNERGRAAFAEYRATLLKILEGEESR